MAGIKQGLKDVWLKGMEAMSKTASNFASSTKYKVDEMNLVNRRREILDGFGSKAYELWQKGEKFPEELEQLLAELGEVDVRLNELRMEHLSNVKADEAEETAEEATEEAPEAEQEEVEEVNTVEVVADECDPASEEEEETVPVLEIPDEEPKTAEKDCPISDAINNLFEKTPSVEDMAGKVNTALDNLGESLKQFGANVEQKVEEIFKDPSDQ